VVAKVEWHPGELYPRVGFIVTNMIRPAERVVAFYNQRGTAERHIKEGKNAVTWTRLSCHRFAANAVRLQLHRARLQASTSSHYRNQAAENHDAQDVCNVLRDLSFSANRCTNSSSASVLNRHRARRRADSA
jgi:hypothetical protein